MQKIDARKLEVEPKPVGNGNIKATILYDGEVVGSFTWRPEYEDAWEEVEIEGRTYDFNFFDLDDADDVIDLSVYDTFINSDGYRDTDTGDSLVSIRIPTKENHNENND